MNLIELLGGWRRDGFAPGGTQWREKMRILWQYLHRDMRDSRAQRAALYPDTHKTHVQRVVPFVWRLSREMASLKRARMLVDPVTGTPLPQGVQDLARAIYAEAGLDRALSSAYGQLVALNQATVWLLPRGPSLRAHTFPPHDQAVELADPLAQHEDDVTAWRILLPIAQDPDMGSVRYATARWTAEDVTWMDIPEDATELPFEGANPFGRIPVVCLRGNDTDPGVWWCHAPDDLLDAQRAINHDMTDIGHIARLQGYSQMYAVGIGPGEADNLKIGPEQLATLSDPTARLDFARPQPDLRGYAEQNEQYMRAVISAEGMNPATFLKSAGITALAKKMEQIDRDAERQKYLDELVRAEQRAYDLVRAYINGQRGAEVLPAARVEIEFREPVVPADPLHDAQALQLWQELGLIGRVRARAKMDGISTDEALRRMAADAELDARAEAVSPAPVDAAEAEVVAEENNGAAEVVAETGVEEVSATALNGAQVQSLLLLIQSVSSKQLPAEAARAIIRSAFPLISDAEVSMMVNSAERFQPVQPVDPEV